MKISARVVNREGLHEVVLKTNGREQVLNMLPKPDGSGSGANGGELLFLALATCYCNDLYREASKRGITIERVQVEVSGEFGGDGEPARNITYAAWVDTNAPREEVLALMRYTDSVAEIQKTLRGSVPVMLASCQVRQVGL